MLSKKILLATIFMAYCGVAQANSWQNKNIEAVLHDYKFLTQDRLRLSLVGIDLSINNRESVKNQCYLKPLNRFLQHTVVENPVKTKPHTTPALRQLHQSAYLKIASNKDLALFLLEQGWAKTNNQKHALTQSYKKTEKQAQKNKKGYWGECNSWYWLREKQRLQGKTDYFPSLHKSYLSTASVGWVKSIKDDGIILLHNGLKIKMQGLKIPKQKSNLQACWNQQIKKYLEPLLTNKKILLQADQLQLTNRGRHLQRYVWLPGNRKQKPKLLNTHLITEGLAQLNSNELNFENTKAMKQAQASFNKQSRVPEWWQQCAKQVVLTKNPLKKPVIAPIYNPTCPIKGNISGSKKNPKKTYHTPASGWYKRIKHEQCFKNEEAAKQAGFVKVK